MRNQIIRRTTVMMLMIEMIAFFGLIIFIASLPHHALAQTSLHTLGVEKPFASLQSDDFQSSMIGARHIITDPGIASPLTLTQDGRQVLVSGHYTCMRGDDYEIQTVVTQRSTGALARGRTQGRCSGQSEQFDAATWVFDEALFAPGDAQACAILITRAQNKVTDVFQWCRKEDVNLKTKTS